MASPFVTAVSTVIEEVLDPDIANYLPKNDRAFAKVQGPTSRGVVPGKLIGRDWKVIKTYTHAVSGVNQFASVTGDSAIDSVGNVARRSSFETWPDPTGAIRPIPFQDSITLTRFKGLMVLDLDIFHVDSLNATIMEYVQEVIKGAVVNVGMAWHAGFYMNDTTAAALYTVDTIDGGATATSVTFTVTAGRIFRTPIGMRVSIHQAAGTLRGSNSTDVIVVGKIDPLAKKVTLVRVAGTLDLTTVISTDDIVLYASYGLALNGLETYLKTSGTVRGITLADHPEFKSLADSTGGAFTRLKAMKYIGAFLDAYRLWGLSIDTIITTQGVVNTALQNDLGSMILNGPQVPGGAMGFDGTAKFRYDGKDYELLPSQMCAHNTAYGVKMADGNWKRYVAPIPNGGQSYTGEYKEHMVPKEVFWANTALGMASKWVNIYGSSQEFTNGVMAPYEAIGQVAPTQVQGILWTGLTETIG